MCSQKCLTMFQCLYYFFIFPQIHVVERHPLPNNACYYTAELCIVQDISLCLHEMSFFAGSSSQLSVKRVSTFGSLHRYELKLLSQDNQVKLTCVVQTIHDLPNNKSFIPMLLCLLSSESWTVQSTSRHRGNCTVRRKNITLHFLHRGPGYPGTHQLRQMHFNMLEVDLFTTCVQTTIQFCTTMSHEGKPVRMLSC